jgi:hypothetical protein
MVPSPPSWTRWRTAADCRAPRGGLVLEGGPPRPQHDRPPACLPGCRALSAVCAARRRHLDLLGPLSPCGEDGGLARDVPGRGMRAVSTCGSVARPRQQRANRVGSTPLGTGAWAQQRTSTKQPASDQATKHVAPPTTTTTPRRDLPSAFRGVVPPPLATAALPMEEGIKGALVSSCCSFLSSGSRRGRQEVCR